MASSPKDENTITALAGQSSTDSTKTAVVAVNPSTNGVIVQLV